MSRRRGLAKGVVGRHVDDKDKVTFSTGDEKAIPLEIMSRADIAKKRAGKEKPAVKKPEGFICKHCSKPYKMKMHLVRHEKGCKKKE